MSRLGALVCEAIAREFARIDEARQPPLPHLVLPDHHDVRGSDVVLWRLHGNIVPAAENGPRDFTQLLQVPGVGARTVRALAMVAEAAGAPRDSSLPRAAKVEEMHGPPPRRKAR